MTHVTRRPGAVAGVGVAVLLAAAHAANDALTAVLGALLPTLQARFAASSTTLAVLVAAFTISSSLTQPALGALAERVGLRRIAAAGIALAAVSLSLIGAVGSITSALVLLVAGGIGSAALHPVATSIVGGPSSSRPGLAVGMFTAGGMAGFAAGPVLVLYLMSRNGAAATAWLMAPGLVLAAAVLLLLPDWEPHQVRSRLLLVFRRTLTGAVGRLTVASALVTLAFITVTSAVPLWLVNQRQVPPDAPLIGWTLAVFSLAAALGAIAGGGLAPGLGPARTAASTMLLAMVALTTILIAAPGVLTLLTAGAAGALLYMNQPVLITAAQHAVPEAPAAAAGTVIGIGGAAAGLLYIAAGIAQDHLGLAPTMIVTFVLLAPAAAIAYRALRTR